jgi:probable rRNA maturation factor
VNAQLPASRLAIDCLVEADGWGDADGPLAERARRAATAAVREGMADSGMGLSGSRPEIELSLVFADDPAVQALNAQWRGKDRPTNVLSFPNCTPDEIARARNGGPPLLLGDVVLALETCQAEARAQGKPLADHVAHLVVHGVLHLFGHEHETDAEAERMEMLEVAILGGLGIADPYRDDQL